MPLNSLSSLSMVKPDDWHLHIRDGGVLKDVLSHTVKQFARAVIMPNLQPPITTVALAQAYRGRIETQLQQLMPAQFTPLMTLYLTDNTPGAEVQKAKDAGIVGIKLYPAGATTNSDSGVSNIKHCSAVLEAMQKANLPLLIHGETTDPAVDVFDREAVFIDRTLEPLRREFPELRIVLGATITPQHLLMNRNAIFAGGIRPHHYCLPVLKREEHRLALLEIATSGNARFFLGTDSAPHPKGLKESACGCAGCFSAFNALGLYAEAFESVGRLDRLEAFASFYGADFYGLPRNTEIICLQKQAQQVPTELPLGDTTIVPLRAGGTISWSLA
jgi:dihydroorotase